MWVGPVLQSLNYPSRKSSIGGHVNNQPDGSAVEARKLHIGGKIASLGWEILNIDDAPGVDHLCNANDLSRFASNTFNCIYASHIVEHLDYSKELIATLAEWLRVLRTGGKLYVSVPDIDVLSKLMLDKERLSFKQRYRVMRIMFGGHTDAYDYHQVGLNEEFLRYYLSKAGYADITKVKLLDMFNDASGLRLNDVLISLNMIAVKPAVSYSGVKRNAPCPCESGKKFKHCHGLMK